MIKQKCFELLSCFMKSCLTQWLTCRRRRMWYQQLLTTLLTCCFSDSWLSSRTPRSRTVVEGFIMSSPTSRLQSKLASFERLAREPNQISSVQNWAAAGVMHTTHEFHWYSFEAAKVALLVNTIKSTKENLASTRSSSGLLAAIFDFQLLNA